MLYLVQCTTTNADGHLVLWWAPKRNGYTPDVDKAGRYTKVEAEEIERLRGEERKVPEQLALALSKRHVAVDDLNSALGKEST
jgi:hypothetical protein